jgi:glycosyltransferase involved in cell wall biosynthesis
LKILHLSESGLPDWRIEKSAQTGLKNGHEVFFAGGKTTNYNKKIFSETYELNWTLLARMGLWPYWRQVKKQLKSLVEKIRPDVVHAHNVYSAKMMSEFDIPFVFDNHEYWAMFSSLLNEIKQFQKPTESKKDHISSIYQNLRIKAGRSLAKRRALKLWTEWEKELTCTRPTITVSKKIAEEFEEGNNKKIFVVPNFPMSKEVPDLIKPECFTKISSIYAGGDGKSKITWPNRNFEGLTNIFEENEIGSLTIVGWKDKATQNVNYTEFLPRKEMYEEMSKHSIGLLPWKKHWTQCYLSPNKPYEYAHAGLLVFCTSTFDSVIENLQNNCVIFEDYADLATKIKYYQENLDEIYEKRKKSYDFARGNLIWEKNENSILKAYQMC